MNWVQTLGPQGVLFAFGVAVVTGEALIYWFQRLVGVVSDVS